MAHYNCDYLSHTIRFYQVDLKLNTDFPPQFCGGFFSVKSPNVTQRSVSQANAFKKSKNPSAFVSQNYRLK